MYSLQGFSLSLNMACTHGELLGVKVYYYPVHLQKSPPSLPPADVHVFFKGIITNCLQLCKDLHLPIDTSIEDLIVQMYLQYGIEFTLQLLDGTFSLLLLDQRVELEYAKIYVATDVMAIQPIYIVQLVDDAYAISTHPLEEDDCGTIMNSTKLSPCTYSEFQLSRKVHSKWQQMKPEQPFMYYRMLWAELPLVLWNSVMDDDLIPQKQEMANLLTKYLSLFETVTRTNKNSCIGILMNDASPQLSNTLHDTLEHVLKKSVKVYTNTIMSDYTNLGKACQNDNVVCLVLCETITENKLCLNPASQMNMLHNIVYNIQEKHTQLADLVSILNQANVTIVAPLLDHDWLVSVK